MNTVKITNTQARLMQIGDPDRSPRFLKPGVNLVPQATYDKVSKEVGFKSWVADGSIKVDTKPTAATTASLADMKPVEAAKLVAETLDVLQLEAWKQAESRPKVLAAIDTQLAAIEAAVKPE